MQKFIPALVIAPALALAMTTLACTPPAEEAPPAEPAVDVAAEGPVVGQEALRASWDAFAAMEDFDVSWEPTAAFVSPDGNMAYDYGTTSATTPDGTVPGKYLVVWVKVDGEWKVAADIFNSSVAPQ